MGDNMTNRFFKKLNDVYPSLSKGHKKIADYISENYDKAAFMIAAKLGETVGVSESTVVRFATVLGYAGYPELQRHLQEMIRSKLTSVQRMEVSNVRIDEVDVLDKALEADISMIRSTLEQTSRMDFSESVKEINKARRIYVLGVRTSASLASFMVFYLKIIFDDVVLIDTSSASEMFEHLFRISKEDVCIAISFPRYSRQTVNALCFAKNRGATIISITDSKLSPIAPLADHLLVARSNMVSFVDSLVAPLSLINALIAASARSRKDDVYQNLQTLESIWEEYKVYDNNVEEDEGK